MTEILTESFCERCGTRYTFETARPQNSRLGRARTLTKGLRNFVLSDDPLSVAMADARGEEERAATSLQLDAFHKTFNFCLSCRQYTCSNCWNTGEGRCLSCSPRLDTVPVEPVEAIDSAAIAERLAAMTAPPAPTPHDVIGVSAWPEEDLPRRGAAETTHAEVAAPEPEAVPAPPEPAAVEAATPEPEAGVEAVVPAPELAALGAVAAEAEPVEAVIPEQEAEPVAIAPEPVVAEPVVAEPAAVEAVEVEAEPAAVEAEAPAAHRVHGLRPGESLAHAIAAYEAERAAQEGEPAEGVSIATPIEQPDAAPEAAEPVADTVLAPEPVVAEPALVEALPIPVAAEPASAAAPSELEPEPTPEPIAAEPIAAGLEPLPAEPELTLVAEPFVPEAIATSPELELMAGLVEPAAVVEPASVEPEALTGRAEPAVPVEPAAPQPEPAAAAPEHVVEPTPAPPARPTPASMAPGWLTVAPDDGAAPVWPQRPTWPVRAPLEGGTLAGRRMVPINDATALWAASAREVLETGPLADHSSFVAPAAAPTAQPCVGCGLPLSANARFCRRCGSRQG